MCVFPGCVCGSVCLWWLRLIPFDCIFGRCLFGSFVQWFVRGVVPDLYGDWVDDVAV